MGLAFDMDGIVATITATDELGRHELPELEQYVVLAVTNDAGAILVDVRESPRVATSVIGHLVRRSLDLRREGILLGLVGLDTGRNPVITAQTLASRLPVFADFDRARIEVRRRIGAASAASAAGP